jgi:recombination protein RecT
MAGNQTLQTPATGKDLIVLKSILHAPNTKGRFEEMLGRTAPQFLASILNTVYSNDKLYEIAERNPMSVYRSATVAAALNLPIDRNLGFTWMVPYGNEAQFQMGYKGFIQLALRTGQYSKINCIPVYQNQFKSWDALQEILDADFTVMGTGKIIGYAFFFCLVTGFSKIIFRYKDELIAHGKRYSKTFNNGPWQSHQDEMCQKTLIKNTISKWGIMSIEMNLAHRADQAIIQSENFEDVNAFVYPDGQETGDESGKRAPGEFDLKLEAHANAATNGK